MICKTCIEKEIKILTKAMKNHMRKAELSFAFEMQQAIHTLHWVLSEDECKK